MKIKVKIIGENRKVTEVTEISGVRRGEKQYVDMFNLGSVGEIVEVPEFALQDENSELAGIFETMPEIVWTKNPSVTRAGKFFYTARINNVLVTVLESGMAGLWQVQTNTRGVIGDGFKSSKTAMLAAENLPVA